MQNKGPLHASSTQKSNLSSMGMFNSRLMEPPPAFLKVNPNENVESVIKREDHAERRKQLIVAARILMKKKMTSFVDSCTLKVITQDDDFIMISYV